MFAVGAALAAPASAFMLRADAAGSARSARLSSRASAVFYTANESREATASAGNATVATTESSVADASWSAARVAGLSTLRLSRQYNVPLGLATEVHKAATSAGISPRVAFGLVRTESVFKRTAVSPVGAIGYTQVMPGTAKTLQPGTTRADLFDARTNLSLGFKYLKTLLDHYDGNVRLALTAYNRGPGIVDRLVKRGRDPENGYASMVLASPARVRLTPQQKQQALAAAAAAYGPAVSPPGATPAPRGTRHVRRFSTPRHHAIASRRPHPVRRHASASRRHASAGRRQAVRGRRHRR